MAYKTLDGQVLFGVRYVSLKYEERVSFSQSTWLYTCSVCFKSHWRSWRDTGLSGFQKIETVYSITFEMWGGGSGDSPKVPQEEKGPRDTERRGKEPSSAGRCWHFHTCPRGRDRQRSSEIHVCSEGLGLILLGPQLSHCPQHWGCPSRSLLGGDTGPATQGEKVCRKGRTEQP